MKCLYCYKNITPPGKEYHEKCSRKLFSSGITPVLDYRLSDLRPLAEEAINRSLAITGVQKKISLDLGKAEGKRKRLTIVGLWGRYILKPPEKEYPEMPELEDLTMHLAKIAGIKTAEHGLIRFNSGELAYITKRFDRTGNEKIAVEDFCQLTENLTEHKYDGGSMEKIGKAITTYSDFTGLDLIKFFNITVFSFLTGNSDMHLKNFSLITEPENQIRFSPAYDLLPTKLLLPADKEEMALPLNGKKKNLKINDFITFGKTIGIDIKVINYELETFNSKLKEMLLFIEKGFLKPQSIDKYQNLIKSRALKLGFSF